MTRWAWPTLICAGLAVEEVAAGGELHFGEQRREARLERGACRSFVRAPGFVEVGAQARRRR